ncbi:Asb13 [Symbiodinium natans]|uniref:Asb13 protein n=1 Tax=Symbiodinium natans TaxID=878477 RepID=A0A812SP97_9DINO|nr:Asb13 [Symbiodinium natans]
MEVDPTDKGKGKKGQGNGKRGGKDRHEYQDKGGFGGHKGKGKGSLGWGRVPQSPRRSMSERLRVWRVSGEELVTMIWQEVEEMADVGALKQHLQKTCGWPRSMLTLLHDGKPLNDDDELRVPMDMQIVLLPFADDSSTSQQQLASALVDAAGDGELEIISQLLDAGADKDGLDKHGQGPLHAACLACDLEVVALLLNAGADMDLMNGDGESPLCAACVGGNEGIVEKLLLAGANPDLGEPLLAAQQAGSDALMQLLLDHGADGACLLLSRSGSYDSGREFGGWDDSVPPSPPSVRSYGVRSFGSGSSF